MFQLPNIGGLQARSARPILTYNGKDVSVEVYPSLIGLRYKEGTDCMGDTVTITLADPEAHFRLSWTLKATVPISLAMETKNWSAPGQTLYRSFGTFYIHTVDIAKSKRSGTVVTLTATSIPVESAARLQKKARAWTGQTLMAVATQVATDNHLHPKYLSKINPKIGRFDQGDESDLNALDRLCKPNGLIMKVKDDSLYIIGEEELDAKPAVGFISEPGGVNGVGGIISWNLSDCVEDVYRAYQVKYYDKRTGLPIEGKATDPDQEANLPTAIDHENPYADDYDPDPDTQGTDPQD